MNVALCMSVLAVAVATAGASGLCDLCDCVRTSANCRNLGLRAMPLDWPSDLTSLDLSDNFIEVLDNLPPPSVTSNLRTLILARNNLTRISQLLDQLKHVEFLDLSINNLQIEMDTFKWMENLRVLNISNNNIREIHDLTFISLIGLKELVLAGNPLHSVTNRLLSPLKSLETLDLSDISSYYLPGDAFKALLNLHHLDLSRNEFYEVPILALRSATHLETLILSDNDINLIEKKSFHGLVKLRHLEMIEMDSLCCIEENGFSALTRLEVLILRDCPVLTVINPTAFQDLHYLREVYLSGNALSTISSELLDFSKLAVVDLQNNRWDCACGIQWMLNVSIPESFASSLRCFDPPELRNQLIRSLQPSMLQCSTDEFMLSKRNLLAHDRVLRVLMLLAVALAALLAVLILVIFLQRRHFRAWWMQRKRKNGAIYYVRAQTNPECSGP